MIPDIRFSERRPLGRQEEGDALVLIGTKNGERYRFYFPASRRQFGQSPESIVVARLEECYGKDGWDWEAYFESQDAQAAEDRAAEEIRLAIGSGI